MHEISVIKTAALHALDDDSEEPKAARLAEFRSIADPLTVLEMTLEMERHPSAENRPELIQLLRELAEYVGKQSSEDAQVLAMKAKSLL